MGKIKVKKATCAMGAGEAMTKSNDKNRCAECAACRVEKRKKTFCSIKRAIV